MKKNLISKSGIFNPRVLLAFTLSSVGAFLALLSLAADPPSGVTHSAANSPANSSLVGKHTGPLSGNAAAATRSMPLAPSEAGWSIVTSPNNGTEGNGLSSVTCASASECWAVGGYVNGDFYQTLIEKWDGASWSIVTANNGTLNNYLSGVTCASASECWAVGYYSDGNVPRQTLIEKWDGTSWSIVTSPSPGTGDNYLSGVTCASASECWAVGYYSTGRGSQTLIEKWDGASWSIVTSPNNGTGFNYLIGVTCASASECWAVGSYTNVNGPPQALIEKWDGASWSIVTANNGTFANSLSGVTCASASECWAVGYYSDFGTGTRQTLIEKWDGTSWSIVNSPSLGPENYLFGVTCASASECWAVGDYSNLFADQTLIEKWDGASWSIVNSPNNGPGFNRLLGVTCALASECWAVGDYSVGNDPTLTLIEEFTSLSLPLLITLRDEADTMDVQPTIEPSILRVSVTNPRSIATLPAFQIRRNKIRLNIKGPASTELSVFIAPDSSDNGGHDHLLPNTNRPHGWLETVDSAIFPPNVGQFGFESGGTTKYSSYSDVNNLIVTTTPTGDAYVYYTAPEICGADLISVSTIDPDINARLVASVIIEVKLNSAFVALQGTPDIELTGTLPAHMNSHWGTAGLKTAIERAAQNYAVEALRGNVPNYPLPVNDMSLIHGGFFDVGGDWNVEVKGHKGHRLGIEVDMGNVSTGHGLVPGANGNPAPYPAFDTLWKEQGWFTSVPEGAGSHYHFVLNGTARVSIAFSAPTVSWQDKANRMLTVHVPFENTGSLDADQVTIDTLQTSPPGAASIQTPLPVTAGVAPRRMVGLPPQGFDILVNVPVGVNGFDLFGEGYTTSGALPPFEVPSHFRGKVFDYFVRVPSSTPSLSPTIPFTAGGGWSVILSNPNQSASAGATVVYSGTIQNNTGADLYLSSADLRFTMSAPDGSYEFELAPEFRDTGGVIPPTGYTGPLFIIHWLDEPPVNAHGIGTLVITPDLTSNLSAQSTGFASYYKPQALEITRAGGKVVLSWALEASSMVLESSGGLDGETEWLPVNAPVVQMNGKNTVTIDLVGTGQFFRLNSYY